MEREQIIREYEDFVNGYECYCTSEDNEYEMHKAVLFLLKEQEEQKRKWLQTIADTQLAISPTGYESENELAKRGWEWNGLQMAWEIIAGEERSEHSRLVRCKDCKYCTEAADKKWRKDFEKSIYECNHMNLNFVKPDWFCADGERQEGR